LYQPNGFTCNHPTAEDGYCGEYRKLNAKKSMFGTMKKVDTSDLRDHRDRA